MVAGLWVPPGLDWAMAPGPGRPGAGWSGLGTPLSWPREGRPTMTLKKLRHGALKGRDLARSEAFYGGVLGLVVTGRLPGRMVFFAVPGNTDSHDLCLWKVGPEAAPQAPAQVGLFHVAWQVD